MLGKLFGKQDDPREITNADSADVYGRQDGTTFLDVREPDEWAEGHLPGAVHIPLGDLQQRAGELPSDERIVTYCRSGGRSLKAVDILSAAGHQDSKSMAGGMIEWKKQGRPVE